MHMFKETFLSSAQILYNLGNTIMDQAVIGGGRRVDNTMRQILNFLPSKTSITGH